MSKTSFEFSLHLQKLRESLSELETQVGISEKTAKIAEGCFIPYGIDGEGAHLPRAHRLENYDDTEFDHQREGIRKLYFQVADIVLRRSLIEQSRLIDRTLRERAIVEKARSHDALLLAQRTYENPPWTISILIGLAAVGGSIWKGGWDGVWVALAGVALVYFQRKDAINNLKGELEQAKDMFVFEVKGGDEWDLRPESFSLQEALTGERDDALDDVSAVYLRALARNRHDSGTKILQDILPALG